MNSKSYGKSSLVDYSKLSDRPDSRQQSTMVVGTAKVVAAATAPSGSGVVSAQMDAVMRLMTGREERTIAEKLADSNRPTWEQYKKDNHDKLNLDTLDQKQMDEYRKQLDEERDSRLAGIHKRHDKKEKKKKKSQKRKHKRKRDNHSSSDESRSSESESTSDDESHRRRKHRKRRKHDKKRKHRSEKNDVDDENSGNHEQSQQKSKEATEKE